MFTSTWQNRLTIRKTGQRLQLFSGFVVLGARPVLFSGLRTVCRVMCYKCSKRPSVRWCSCVSDEFIHTCCWSAYLSSRPSSITPGLPVCVGPYHIYIMFAVPLPGNTELYFLQRFSRQPWIYPDHWFWMSESLHVRTWLTFSFIPRETSTQSSADYILDKKIIWVQKANRTRFSRFSEELNSKRRQYENLQDFDERCICFQTNRLLLQILAFSSLYETVHRFW